MVPGIFPHHLGDGSSGQTYIQTVCMLSFCVIVSLRVTCQFCCWPIPVTCTSWIMQIFSGQMVRMMAGLSLSFMIYGGSATWSYVSCKLVVQAQHFRTAFAISFYVLYHNVECPSMQYCNSHFILAVRFEAHQIFKQALLSWVHKFQQSCWPMHNLFSVHDQTLLSFMLSSIFVGPWPNLCRSKHKHKCNRSSPYLRPARNAKLPNVHRY